MKTQLDFMRLRFYAYGVSILLLLISLLSLSFRGLNLGLDFTGGTVIEVRFKQNHDISRVRNVLEKSGLSVQVQETAQNTTIVKLKLGEDTSRALEGLKTLGEYELIRSETIGGIVSSELRQKAVWAIISALVGILVYLGYRFEPLWAFSAILALVHDVLIVVGAYSLTQREVNLDVVASLLIVAGYSVTDTVVVFDRIRENIKVRKASDLYQLINLSVNQTLSRTIMTSLTTFVVSLSLFLLGGPALSNIMFAFVVGVVVGTLSSIFVASALVLDIRSRLLKKADAGL